jgi:hypothetical protein
MNFLNKLSNINFGNRNFDNSNSDSNSNSNRKRNVEESNTKRKVQNTNNNFNIIYRDINSINKSAVGIEITDTDNTKQIINSSSIGNTRIKIYFDEKNVEGLIKKNRIYTRKN